MFKKLVRFLFLFSMPVWAKGPPNDSFANAQELSGAFPIKVKSSITDGLDRFRATKEAGEPDHAGQKGKGSVWFSWTPTKDDHVGVVIRGNRGNLDRWGRLPS